MLSDDLATPADMLKQDYYNVIMDMSEEVELANRFIFTSGMGRTNLITFTT